jgi:hypothetical protein
MLRIQSLLGKEAPTTTTKVRNITDGPKNSNFSDNANFLNSVWDVLLHRRQFLLKVGKKCIEYVCILLLNILGKKGQAELQI